VTGWFPVSLTGDLCTRHGVCEPFGRRVTLSGTDFLVRDWSMWTLPRPALVYWLARRVMGRLPSAAATLSVMWLCAFKQAGNYILPYSYSALHGCASCSTRPRDFGELRQSTSHIPKCSGEIHIGLENFTLGSHAAVQ